MKKYIIYNLITGYIIRTGVCPSDMFSKQIKIGEGLVEGEANDETQMIDIITLEIIPKH
jgi:hypothetical protein